MVRNVSMVFTRMGWGEKGNMMSHTNAEYDAAFKRELEEESSLSFCTRG
jgi:hypothetical protein